MESGLILQRVSRWKREIARHIWVRIIDGELDSEQRIRAAAALIHTADFDSDEWAEIGKETTDALVSRDPLFVNAWVDELTPMRHAMRPRLVEISLTSTVPIDRRLTAASVIRHFSQQDVSYLDARSLLELVLSPNASIRNATDGILLQRQSELMPMILEIASAPLEPGTSAESEHAVKHAATAILVAQRLEQDKLFWEQLNELIDPRVRTELINRIDEAKLTWRDSQTHLRHQPAAARQAIVLGLAENLSQFSNSEVEQIRAAFVDLFQHDPDSGVHSAAEYALHTASMGDELPGMRLELANEPTSARNWQILSNGLCMIYVERPGWIRLGSSDSQTEMGFLSPNREVDIAYPFEISTTEISVRQFREFRADALPAHLVTPSEDCPMSRMDLFSAMRFCRWLSEQQPGFDETNCCYPPVDQIGPNLRLPDDYLRRPGFRLPTVHEWEYSVRAGSTTSRFSGNSVEQLNRYCWWVGSSQQRLWPVGLKCPNAWGLFDIHGNVLEWCHEAEIAFDPVGQPVRGGDYRSTERFLRSSFAEYAKSANTLSTIGFRVVRIR